MVKEHPKVLVKEGWLEGEKCKLVTGNGSYYSFKGIPYAAPPVGSLRFKAPQPPEAWTGIRKATEHGPVSPQYDYIAGHMALGSEDCLYLNVYTQTLHPDKPKAVMVFIHGGGFVWGSGNEDNYGPDFLVEQDVVLVTINYRLGALGFLCLDTKDVPGNAGMKDQVMALKWVQNNILQFGGDPRNVTVFGESAGGVSTGLHTVSPLSKGLLRRVIPMSGTLYKGCLAHEPRKRAFALGKELGLETDDPEALLNFLQSVSTEKLVTTNVILDDYEQKTDGLWKVFKYAPVVEKDFGQERFLEEDPIESLKKGAGADVDVMIGFTDEETIFALDILKDNFLESYDKHPDLFLPAYLSLNMQPDRILMLSKKVRDRYFGDEQNTTGLRECINYLNDLSFCNTLRFMKLLLKSNNAKRYFYRFCCVSERNIYGAAGQKYGIIGAGHLDDMVYLFDPKRVDLKLDTSSKTYEMIKLSCKVFTNFAKFGTPTPDSSLGVSWPEYDQRSRRHAEIGATLTLGADLDAAAYDFWSKIIKEGLALGN